MWKILLFLAIMLGLAPFANAQNKSEFGFVVKSGTYSLPGKRSFDPYNTPNYTRNLRHHAGRIHTFGVWYALPLLKRLHFSSELFYRHSSIETSNKLLSRTFEGDFISTVIEQVRESSLSLPLKLHLLLQKDGKASFFMGGGLTRVFTADIYTEIENQWYDFKNTSSKGEQSLRLSKWGKFQTHYNLNAGFLFQIAPKTTLGLEYTFEPVPKYSYYEFNDNGPGGPRIDCFCQYPDPELRIRMNSISVSLRHNILD